MKVLFGLRNDGADGWFRGTAPASMLRYQGIDATAGIPTVDHADEYDVLILCRHADPVAELIVAEFQRAGKPVVYDVDDWLFGLPPSWPAYGDYFVRGTARASAYLLHHQRLLERADMVTCTNHTLANLLREYNSRVRVVPNCILWAAWDALDPLGRDFEGPVIGWFGLPYYWDTWREMAEPVEQAVMETNANLVILGFPEAVKALSPRLAERTIVEPMVRWSQFARLRQMIATFDVGIAWQPDGLFYRCKSPLKAFQYGAAGVPIVASQSVYGELLTCKNNPGKYGLVVDNLHGLYYGIKNSLTHREPARLRAAAWRDEVFLRHSYETQWRNWLAILEELYGVQDETPADD